MNKSDILTNIECGICYKRFINLKSQDFDLFVESNKHNLPTHFYYDNRHLMYQDRFECLSCNNNCCSGCIWDVAVDIKPNYEIVRETEATPMICKFCGKHDYRDWYYPPHYKIPAELLCEIKSLGLKYKKKDVKKIIFR